MTHRMARAIAENRLSRKIKNLTRPKLLIIDEVGYLALEQVHASLLFLAICERYKERQAVILTSNKAFADWSQVFAGSQSCDVGGFRESWEVISRLEDRMVLRLGALIEGRSCVVFRTGCTSERHSNS